MLGDPAPSAATRGLRPSDVPVLEHAHRAERLAGRDRAAHLRRHHHALADGRGEQQRRGDRGRGPVGHRGPGASLHRHAPERGARRHDGRARELGEAPVEQAPSAAGARRGAGGADQRDVELDARAPAGARAPPGRSPPRRSCRSSPRRPRGRCRAGRSPTRSRRSPTPPGPGMPARRLDTVRRKNGSRIATLASFTRSRTLEWCPGASSPWGLAKCVWVRPSSPGARVHVGHEGLLGARDALGQGHGGVVPARHQQGGEQVPHAQALAGLEAAGGPLDVRRRRHGQLVVQVGPLQHDEGRHDLGGAGHRELPIGRLPRKRLTRPLVDHDVGGRIDRRRVGSPEGRRAQQEGDGGERREAGHRSGGGNPPAAPSVRDGPAQADPSPPTQVMTTRLRMAASISGVMASGPPW